MSATAIIGGIAAGAAALGSGALTAVSGRRNVKRTIQANKEASDLAWQRSLSAWEMENAYNTPAAQMQRYADAGLNPHLIYGNGSSSAGNASSIDSPPQPTYKDDSSRGADIGQGITSAVQGFHSIQLQSAQIDNVQAQNELIRAQTDKTRAEALRAGLGYELDSAYSHDERTLGVFRQQQDLGTATYSHDIRRIESEITRATKDSVIERVKQDLHNASRQGRNLDADYAYKLESTVAVRLENELRRLGINPNDPTYLRILGRSLNAIFNSTDLKSYLNNRFNKTFLNNGR